MLKNSDFIFNLLNGYNSDTIEILGFKLHLDDLLLMCIIFCLYKEGTQDTFLLMCLILLLFS